MKTPTKIVRVVLFTAICVGPLFAHALGKKIAIVGGGMAGVAAATFLKDTAHDVHLFEAEATIGGNAKTIVIKNQGGQNVAVDAGPQYFAEGAWDLYIDFLRYFGLFDPNDFLSFDTSLLITKESDQWPIMATPRAKLSHLAINMCHDNLANLRALKELIDRSHDLYRAKIPDTNLSVEDWLDEIRVDDKRKNEVFLPFLASILGTTITQTKQLSALSLANLYAFRSPTLCQKSRFQVSKRGMGQLIKSIGEIIQKSKNIHIHTLAKVARIESVDDGYLVEIDGWDPQRFDAVIIASHPTQSAQMLQHPLLSKQLASLPYISARLVLHTDHSRAFVDPEYPAHFNIILDGKNEVMTTMNLEEIDEKRYRGLLKSWVNSDETFWLMKGVQHTIVFQHPLMTPYFLNTVAAIQDGLKNDAYGLRRGLALAGGWTQAHETQNTAIFSAYKAVLSLDLLNQSETRVWESKLGLWKHNE